MTKFVAVFTLFVVMSSSCYALTMEDVAVVGNRLSMEAEISLIFEIEESPELNAWVTGTRPVVTITRGMLEALTTKDELAFVLGHEITHLKSKHIMGRLKAMGWGALLGGLLGYAVSGDKEDIMLGVELGAGISGGHRSRGDEREADAISQVLCWRSGYDAAAAIDVLSLLQATYGNGTAHMPVLGWLASHPDTGTRIANAKRIAKQIMADNPLPPQTSLSVSPLPSTVANSTFVPATQEELSKLKGYGDRWKIR